MGVAKVSDFEAWIGEILDVPSTQVTDELGPATWGGWTSLRHVQLVSAAQRRYAVRFTPGEVRAVRSVRDLRDSLRGKGVQL
jgi:acyl carrier protein